MREIVEKLLKIEAELEKRKRGDALAAYNAGEGNVAMWLKDERYSADGKTLFSIPYRETKNHVRKTLRYREKYQKIYKM